MFTNAQKNTQYFSWQWKPCEIGLARFIAVIEHTDSGWFRNDFFAANNQLQMQGLYKDSACKIANGRFTYFYPDGKVSSSGKYVNEKKQGLWYSYHSNGMMRDSSVYEAGEKTGTSMGWHSNGYMSDSALFNSNGSAIHVGWFDNGLPSFSGKTMTNKKEGPWRFFHKNGNTAALEKYEQDKLISRIYYDEDGVQLTDTTNKDRDAEFNGGIEKWKKFLEKNLQFPTGYKITNTDIVTITVTVLIDEEGNVTEPYVDIPFKPVFDKEALRVIKKSPKWLPAVSHNRKVKMYIRQPISFKQDIE
jgi:hypothetical protein